MRCPAPPPNKRKPCHRVSRHPIASRRPSKRNQAAFDRAVNQVAASIHQLPGLPETAQPPHNRVVEAAKAKARSAARFA
ncbi:MAG: DUF2277 family protein [Alphaproteobacteria bacterium]|nr:DUF2277 family protein [Alphaproteobacteria bacterium]